MLSKEENQLGSISLAMFGRIINLQELVKKYRGTIELNYCDNKEIITLSLQLQGKHLMRSFYRFDYAYTWLKALEDYADAPSLPVGKLNITKDDINKFCDKYGEGPQTIFNINGLNFEGNLIDVDADLQYYQDANTPYWWSAAMIIDERWVGDSEGGHTDDT